jgi:hypothetical protein
MGNLCGGGVRDRRVDGQPSLSRVGGSREKKGSEGAPNIDHDCDA